MNRLFTERGAPGDPPERTKLDKCLRWLALVNEECADPLSVVGGIIEDMMEQAPASTHYGGNSAEDINERNHRVHNALSRHGLKYAEGGRIYSVTGLAPSRTLDSILRARDLPAPTAEFDRAQAALTTDPAAAVLAACAILEALCKVYIEDTNDLGMPGTDTIKPLWATVQKHLGLAPATVVDEDLRRVLSGLSSIVDGLGAVRTHASSAHGRGRDPYRVQPRHARLTVNAAHTLAVFLLETWDVRRGIVDEGTQMT